MNIITIEDEIKMNRQILKKLKFLFEEYFPITNYYDAIDYIDNLPPPDVIILDMNLGQSEYEGIPVLTRIKEKIPDALVIVYTFYDHVEPKCREIGLKNFYFIEKDTTNWEEDMNKIEELIKEYKRTIYPEQIENNISYDAQICHIEELENGGWTKLLCHSNDKEEMRIFNSGPIKSVLMDDFKINKWVRIKVCQIGGEIRVHFEKLPALKEEDIDDIESEIDDERFMGAKIWKHRKEKK